MSSKTHSQSSSSTSYYSSSDSFNSSSISSYDSDMQTTPIKLGHKSSVWEPAPEMRSRLKIELSGHIYKPVAVEAFVTDIWRIDKTTVDTILEANISLPTEPFQTYKNILTLKKHTEKELHLPFRQMTDQLLLDVCTHLTMDPDNTIKRDWWDRSGNGVITTKVGGTTIAQRKPDLLWGMIPLPAGDMPWALAVTPLEFKRHSNANNQLETIDENLFAEEIEPMDGSVCETEQQVESTRASTSKPTRATVSSSTTKKGKNTKNAKNTTDSKKSLPSATGKRCHSEQNNLKTAAIIPSAGRPSKTYSQAGQKRSHEEVDGNAVPPRKKRSRASNTLTVAKAQLGTYALECLACANRFYVVGVFIDRLKISFWYFDRVAVISSCEFKLDDPHGPRYLALCLFAINQCSMRSAGFDPHIHRFTPPADISTPIDESSVQVLEKPVQIPDEESIVQVLEGPVRIPDEESSVEVLEKPMQIPDKESSVQVLEKPMQTPNTESKLCFRFPKNPLNKDFVFEIKNRLFSYRGIVGRGTYVAAVRAFIMNQCLYRDHCAIKFSWQYTVRKPEGEILSALRKALPYWKKHLPEPIFSASYTPEELGIPRSKMALEDPNTPPIQDRNLHVLVSDLYVHLWAATSVEEFKRAFLDCLECHYHVYHTGRVLHRDISENNLVIWRPISKPENNNEDIPESVDGDQAESVAESTQSLGVLNDFDMAAEVNEAGELHVSAAHHRTGTLPFMARDLLETAVQRHLYRHDLESFFYILIWAAVHYDFKTKHPRPTHDLLKPWLDSSNAAGSKALLINGKLLRNLEKIIPPDSEFKELWTSWIVPLNDMFNESSFQDYKSSRGKISRLLAEQSPSRRSWRRSVKPRDSSQ